MSASRWQPGHVATRAQDSSAVVAEQAADQHNVTLARAIRAKLEAFADDADPSRGQKQLVAGALGHDLGVAGDDGDSSLARRRRHRRGDLTQEVDRHAFLDDRGAGQIKRLGAADRKIVDGAGDRDPPDVAAGKDQRIDHEGIGSERKPVAAAREVGQIEARLVLQRRQQRIVEGAHEHVVDEILHRLAAAAMRKGHGRDVDPAERSRADWRGDIHWAVSRCLSPPY
jgi:hypothetical protein